VRSITIFLSTLLLLFCSADCFLQTSTARFMLWHPSARSASMGGVGTAIPTDGFAVFYNPAGLAFCEKVSLVGSYVKPFPFLARTTHSLIALVIPIKPVGTIGISANLFWKDSQLQTSPNSPDPIGEDLPVSKFFFTTHWEIKLTYAALLAKNTSVGLNLSYLKINLSNTGAGSETRLMAGRTSTFLFGAGLLWNKLLPFTTWKPDFGQSAPFVGKYADNGESAGFSVGLALANSGTKITYVDFRQSDSPPTKLSLGLAYWPFYTPLLSMLMSVDFEKEVFEPSLLDYIHLGTESRFAGIFALRAG